MSDDTGASISSVDPAASAAPASPAPTSEAQGEPASAPRPVSSPAPTKEPEPKPEKPVSTRDALKAAAEKVAKDNPPAKDAKPDAVKTDAKAADTKAEPKAEAKTEPARGEHGHFAPKEGTQPTAEQRPAADQQPVGQQRDASSRFNEDARRDWATVPDTVKSEVERNFRNLEAGIEKYKPAAHAYLELAEFHELAQQSGTTLKDAMSRYVNIERELSADPVKGLETICQNMGMSLRQVAEHVLGVEPDQQAAQSDQTIRELREELAGLKQQIGPISQHIQHTQSREHEQTISEWAKDKPLFSELRDEIMSKVVNDGLKPDDAYATAVTEAQDKARRLLGSAGHVAAEQPAKPNPLVADKGSKSITGAPSPGSSPGTQKPSSSTREALKRAFAQAGA